MAEQTTSAQEALGGVAQLRLEEGQQHDDAITVTLKVPEGPAASGSNAEDMRALPPPPTGLEGESKDKGKHYSVSVSNKAGYLCHVHVQADWPMPPSVPFAIFTHPDNSKLFRDIQRVGQRKVIRTEPLYKEIQVEQLGEIQVLWMRRTYSTWLQVVEDMRDPDCLRTEFHLLRSDVLGKFSGKWELRSVRDPTTGQVIGCRGELHQDVLPKGMPSFLASLPVLGNVLRGISVRAVCRVMDDMNVVMDKVRAGHAAGRTTEAVLRDLCGPVSEAAHSNGAVASFAFEATSDDDGDEGQEQGGDAPGGTASGGATPKAAAMTVGDASNVSPGDDANTPAEGLAEKVQDQSGAATISSGEAAAPGAVHVVAQAVCAHISVFRGFKLQQEFWANTWAAVNVSRDVLVDSGEGTAWEVFPELDFSFIAGKVVLAPNVTMTFRRLSLLNLFSRIIPQYDFFGQSPNSTQIVWEDIVDHLILCMPLDPVMQGWDMVTYGTAGYRIVWNNAWTVCDGFATQQLLAERAALQSSQSTTDSGGLSIAGRAGLIAGCVVAALEKAAAAATANKDGFAARKGHRGCSDTAADRCAVPEGHSDPRTSPGAVQQDESTGLWGSTIIPFFRSLAGGSASLTDSRGGPASGSLARRSGAQGLSVANAAAQRRAARSAEASTFNATDVTMPMQGGRLSSATASGDTASGAAGTGTSTASATPANGANYPNGAAGDAVGGAAMRGGGAAQAGSAGVPAGKEAAGSQEVMLGQLIGSGSFGKVYKGTWRGVCVAVKVICHDRHNTLAAIENELQLSLSFEHRNVVRALSYIHCSIDEEGKPTLTVHSRGKASRQPPRQLSAFHDPSTLGFGDSRFTAASAAGDGCDNMIAAVYEGDAARKVAGGELGTDGQPLHRGTAETWVIQEYMERGTLARLIRSGGLSFRHIVPAGAHDGAVDQQLSDADQDGQPPQSVLGSTPASPRVGSAAGLQYPPDMRLVVHCALDVARGLHYLHSRQVVHGDLKPGNILLAEDPQSPWGYVAKLADFGLSRALADRTHLTTNTMGTVSYMCPELLSNGKVSPASCVYSYGIILWELVSGRAPHSGRVPGHIIKTVVVEDLRPDFAGIPGVPDWYIALARRCWDKDPAVRPAMSEVVQELESHVAAMP
ncbi:hypothetical protein GPECTOR_21g688 [Gonium pectorale]|uniref:Protein kinase domain-containing protein n=1 Tax=Gonium pectorale TaxID=33097 RepID=A0A150GHZ7_GONPE|nr:hypothetical protein GPECTOR_21g688 [Gonium pectorale]|eukprot:KXZ49462.1 hypothetical protein GPECTOR_21g688 [Gonium pectorale]